jgi:hypothetical protein
MKIERKSPPAGTVSPHGLEIHGVAWKFRRVPAPLYDCNGQETIFYWDLENKEFVIRDGCYDAAIFIFAQCVLLDPWFQGMKLTLIDDVPDRFDGFPRAADLRRSRQNVCTTAAAVGPSPAA